MRLLVTGLLIRPLPAVVFTALLVLCPSVSAQSAQASDDEYGTLIAQAVSEFGLGNWEEARTLFTRAHEMNPNARTLRGLGMVEFELRHYVESVRLLEKSLQDGRNPLTDEQRQQVEKLATRARSFIGSYHIKLKPPEASLMVDGAPMQLKAGGLLLLDPGDHTIKASAAGYKEQTRKLDVRGGEDESLSFALTAGFLQPAGGPERADRAEDEGGILEKWWFWTIAAVAMGAIVTGVVIATSGEEVQPLLPGDDGVTVTALSLP